MTLFVQCIEHMALGNHVIAESGKFRLLDDMLPEMQSSGDRVLIFSQFTMMMDIMEKYLKLRGHRYASWLLHWQLKFFGILSPLTETS